MITPSLWPKCSLLLGCSLLLVPFDLLFADVSPAAEFAKSIIEAMSYIKQADGRTKTDTNDLVRDLTDLRISIKDLDNAANAIAPYTKSSDETKQTCAKGLMVSIAGLVQYREESIALMDKMYRKGNITRADYADLAQEMSKAAAEVNETWDIFTKGIIMASYAIIEFPNGAKTGNLAMTESERKELLASIDSDFPKAKEGPEKIRIKLPFSAAAFRKVLVEFPARPAGSE